MNIPKTLSLRKKHFLLLVLSIFLFHSAQGQSGYTKLSARAKGMGYTGATLSDGWSAFNNIAGLGDVKGSTAQAAIENRYGIEGFNNMGAAFTHQLNMGTAGLSLFRFGDELYSEQQVGVGYGKRAGLATIGGQINYRQYRIRGLGTEGVLSFDLGVIAKISPQIHVGAHASNINRPLLSDFENERVPSILNAGISFRPTEKLMLNVETEKDIAFGPRAKIGLEYLLFDKASLRLGVNTAPFISLFGIGFILGKLVIDYAFAHDGLLGFSHQASFSYHFFEKLLINDEDRR